MKVLRTLRIDDDLWRWAKDHSREKHQQTITWFIIELLETARDKRAVVNSRPGPRNRPADELVIGVQVNIATIKNVVEEAIKRLDWPDAEMSKIEVICNQRASIDIAILNLPEEGSMIHWVTTSWALEDAAGQGMSAWIDQTARWIDKARDNPSFVVKIKDYKKGNQNES